jgi:hypothetical protein
MALEDSNEPRGAQEAPLTPLRLPKGQGSGRGGRKGAAKNQPKRRSCPTTLHFENTKAEPRPMRRLAEL